MKIQIDSDLEPLIPGFLNNRRKDIEKMRAMLSEKAYDSIGQIGHTMKGNGAGYGFERITEIGLSIEMAAKQQKIEALNHHIEELARFINEVEIEYS
jgi:HPt (histidine-containing phosphotransfer) domain-containing protein